jgi:signal transduction histidine kinase
MEDIFVNPGFIFEIPFSRTFTPAYLHAQMLKSFLTAVLALALAYTLSAQRSKTDSLIRSVQVQPDDTGKVNTLNLLSRQLYVTGKTDSGLAVAREAITLGNKLGFKKGVANGYNNIGNVYFYTGVYDSSIANHEISLQLQTEIGNFVGIASSNNNMGNIYFMEGNFPAALNRYLHAKSTYEQLPPETPMVQTNLSAAYNNIGNVNLYMKRYDSSLVYYKTALEMRKKLGNQYGVAECYGNIGTVHYLMHNYSEALKNHEASLEVKRQIDDIHGIAMSYGNIGSVYFDLKEYDNALENFFASARLCDSLGNPEPLANAYSNIAQVYVKQGKHEEAIRYSMMSLKIGEELKSAEIQKNAYNGIYQADSALGRWEDAYSNHQKFVYYRDQLLNEETIRNVEQARLTYEFEKQQAQTAAIQQAKLEREQLTKWFVAGGLLLVLILMVVSFQRWRLKRMAAHQLELNRLQKEQADAVMETQESERKRIAEDLHDSLGHLLSTAKMHLQSLPEDQKPRVDSSMHLLNQASEEIRNITFNLMPRTLEEGGLIPALHELANKVSKAGVVHVNLQVHNMDRFILDKQSQFNIYRIVQEAVNNILKHADAKEISIQLIGQEDHLSIMIEDDGKGFDTTTKKTGRGLKNIVSRSLWLKGHLHIDSQPGRGTTITTEIPI